jgi:hypothetical protein
MHYEHIRRPAQIRDMGEIAHRIEAGVLGVHRRRQHMGGHPGRHQGVAVGLAARDRLGPDEAAAAGAVLNNELLGERLAQPLGEHPRQQVVRTAGRIGDHDLHRLGRPFRRRGAARQKQRERGKQAFHHVLSARATPHNRASRPGSQYGSVSVRFGRDPPHRHGRACPGHPRL